MSKNTRSFFMSMGITICLLAFLSGMLYVDHQTRQIGFGDNTPIISMTEDGKQDFVRFYVMGADVSMDVSWLKWLLEQSGKQARTICNTAQWLWNWTLDIFTNESRLHISCVL